MCVGGTYGVSVWSIYCTVGNAEIAVEGNFSFDKEKYEEKREEEKER